MDLAIPVTPWVSLGLRFSLEQQKQDLPHPHTKSKLANYGDTVSKFTYDVLGNIVDAESPDSHETYQYDQMGRMIEQTNVTLNKTKTFEYDSVGNLTKMVNEEGRSFTYTYDRKGNMTTFTDPDDQVTHYFYDALNRQVEKQLPNGMSENRVFSADGLLETLSNYKDGQLSTSQTYIYDANGYKMSITVL